MTLLVLPFEPTIVLSVGGLAVLWLTIWFLGDLHTHVRQPDGEDLMLMCERLKIRPRIVHQYYYALGIDASSLADVMSSFDVFLNLAHGEGFGIPIIETMACGVPTIAPLPGRLVRCTYSTMIRLHGRSASHSRYVRSVEASIAPGGSAIRRCTSASATTSSSRPKQSKE